MKPLFTKDQAEKLAQNFPPAEGEKRSSSEVCRACGRQVSGQDPNVVARKFLAELIGQPVTVRVSAEWSVTGTLKRFDNYCLILSLPDQPEVIIFKGPGVTVSKATELCK